jgi:FkbM family methyltransferase
MASQSTMLSRHSAPLLLLAGWNLPEPGEGKVWRWSSLRSQIGLRKRAAAIRLAGWSPPGRRIRLQAGSSRLVELEVDGDFSLEAVLPASAVLVDLFVDQATRAPGEPRELGVRLCALSWRDDGRWQDVDLSTGFEGLVRFKHQAAATTLGQLRRREAHDPDFLCFAHWKGEPIETILDVGANRGQSLASLLSVMPGATVHCFEANPLYVDVLAQVARSLGHRCVIHPFGLGEESGELTFFVPWSGDVPYLEECSTVRAYYEAPWVAQKFVERGGLALEEHKVQIRRGDDLGLRPQLVKIDVEGAERAVIRGLEETIRVARPMLLVENSDWQGVTELLGYSGYMPYQYDATNDRLHPMQGASTNCFYLRPEHARGFRIAKG